MTTEQRPLPSGFNDRARPADVLRGVRLEGQTVVITGGHSGIGLVCSRAVSKAGARVVVGARDVDKARQVLSGLSNVRVLRLDLGDPRSVDAFAESFLTQSEKLDVLLNNAGVMALPTLTRDARGYEQQFATNHLGHFQLTARLAPALVKSGHARVVSLSSYGHRFSPVVFEDLHFERRPYERWSAYGQSKTANSLFAVELDRRGVLANVRAFAVHPGRIPGTNLKRHMSLVEQLVTSLGRFLPTKDGIRLKSVEEGASTSLWTAVSPQLEGKGGVYCADCDVSPLVHEASSLGNSVRDYAVDAELAKRLWTVSEEMTGVKSSL